MADYALWGTNPTGLPGSSVSFGAPTSCATTFKVTSAGIWLKGYRWYDVDSSQIQTGVRFASWTVTGAGTGTLLTGSTVTSGALTIGTVPNDIFLTAPVQLTSGQSYCAVVGDDQQGLQTTNYWNAGGTGQNGITSGPLFAFSEAGGAAPEPNGNNQGLFQQTSNDPAATFPTSQFSSSNFWVSPIVTDTPFPQVLAPYSFPQMRTELVPGGTGGRIIRS